MKQFDVILLVSVIPGSRCHISLRIASIWMNEIESSRMVRLHVEFGVCGKVIRAGREPHFGDFGVDPKNRFGIESTDMYEPRATAARAIFV